MIRALLFGVYIRAPDFGKLPERGEFGYTLGALPTEQICASMPGRTGSTIIRTEMRHGRV